MLENRKILSATLGIIIGIIMGLYCKISIVLFYVCIFIIVKIFAGKDKKKKFKLISIKRYSRYVKIIFTKKVFIIIVIFSIISNCNVLYQDNRYNNLYSKYDEKEVVCKGIICENPTEKENKYIYKVKVISINGLEKYKNTYLYVAVKKNLNLDFKYGEKVKIEGTFEEPSVNTNYKGFNYKEYLKTLKIYGTINLKSKNMIEYNSKDQLFILSNNLASKIKENINKYFSKEVAGIINGILLGDKSKIDGDVIENFSESNISHILAVSGMHVAYLTLIFNFIFEKLCGRRKANIITSLILIMYMFITGFSPSVVRASISGILLLLAEIFYRKSDTWENIGLSLFIILIYNPFLIKNASVLLSFGGTIGIVMLNKNILEIGKLITERLEKKNIRRRKNIVSIFLKLQKQKIFVILKEAIILSISANLAIIPIILTIFNKVTVLSLIIGIVVGFIIGPTVILGIIFVIISFTKIRIAIKMVVILEDFFINAIKWCSKVGANMPLNNIYLATPNMFEIVFYYLVLFISIFLIKIYFKKSLLSYEIRIKNLISLFKYKINQNKQKITSIFLIICILFSVFIIIPRNLKIYFIDVGQGDSTLIITPKNKKILVDGGGSLSDTFDVGKEILMPYLLDRRIAKIDYIIISHFDADHVRTD